MNLSTKSRYGLMALANLLNQDCCCSVKKISEAEHISSDYLEKIFSKLKKAGILKVERGACGGYSINGDPKKITLSKVVNALEKAEFTCPDFCTCQSKSVWQKIQSGFGYVLSSITLDQLSNFKNKSIYLDYAASTPVDSEVLATMLPYFSQNYSGNTMSLHKYGNSASQIVESCRQTFADILKVKSSEIIFTSSATESNNTVLKGVAFANKSKGKHIIISSIEHDCVLNSAKWLETQGFEISQISVDKFGLLNLDELKKTIRPDTILVSIIHGNNEIGTIQDLASIGQICHDRGVYFHTDASQSFTKTPINLSKLNIDLLTASSHKIYGPKGSALLYIKTGTKITPLLHGGGHEFGFRSSTVNLPAIVGFTKAAEIAIKNFDQEKEKLTKIRDYLINNILKTIPDSHLNGHPTKRLFNNINISFDRVEGESLLLELDFFGIAASTGSACSSMSLEPSHVLLATGLKSEQAHGSLRFSLGRFSTKAEADYLLEVLPQVINKFRALSPFKG
ncbi:MAG: IscS subfamily cysteine desulfurase [Candidatus Shapirobacteria bacterium]|nr:IscS subfamily cysteine desulfurase [Candidatus Shapirobacteria bacterium]